MIIDNKAHTRKGKSLAEFSSKNIFQILQKIQNLLFTVKIGLFALYHLRAAQLKYE